MTLHIGIVNENIRKMDYLEFIARLTFHIPDKGQVMVRYYGLSADAAVILSQMGDRGQIKNAIADGRVKD